MKSKKINPKIYEPTPEDITYKLKQLLKLNKNI